MTEENRIQSKNVIPVEAQRNAEIYRSIERRFPNHFAQATFQRMTY